MGQMILDAPATEGSPGSGAPSERLLRFERAMARIRWFGIAFGIFQVVGFEPYSGTTVPSSMYVISGSALALLAAINIWVRGRIRGEPTEAALHRTAAIAFAADIAALWAIIWAFSFEQFGATWVILAIASLEGALRYQLRGALLPVALAVPVELLRDLYRHDAFGFPFFLDGFTFRIGFTAIIAAVAGVMARDLARERDEAVRRAGDLADLAEREQEARAESNAFQEVILAGVSATGMQEALQQMVEHIADDLGYEHIAVLMREDERLHVVAMRGFSPDARERSVTLEVGIAGAVAASGRTEIVPDVTKDDRYELVEPTTRSQVTIPILAGGQTIGVLDCESPDLDAFDHVDAARLERLAAQMALVVENARLLSQERAMVGRLRELDQMRSDFIAIASHELRTPLTAIQGSIKTLRRPDITVTKAQLDEFLGVLDRQSDRLTRLVEDLLMVSHIDAGGVSLRMGAVDLGGALADILDEIGAPGARVSVALPPRSEPVWTDGHRLRQIARNLIDNALKFSTGTVRVTIHHRDTEVMIEVADEGGGIAATDLEKIFERFYQVGGSLRRHGEGFGLGLYITKRLTEALGGRIEVSSREGTGTMFRVVLPVALSGASRGIAYDAGSSGGSGASGASGAGGSS